MDLRGRSYLQETDLSADEYVGLLDLAVELRHARRTPRALQAPGEGHLRGKHVALIFEKTSTRTRSAFEVAAHSHGAHSTYLGSGESQLGEKESVEDTARVLGRMFDGIAFRGFRQVDVEQLAAHAGVPVWNALTDEWHPTQSLADLLTMRDHAGRPLKEIAVCYVGDAANNTCASLLTAGALVGMDVRVAAPKERHPRPDTWERAVGIAEESGARMTLTDDPKAAVAGADFVYTDVWLSLGEPPERWDERIDLLLPYQVGATLMRAAQNPDVGFLHCLPAFHDAATSIGRTIQERRGLDALEVSDEVFESPASLVFDQAENRLHTIAALMVATIGEERTVVRLL